MPKVVFTPTCSLSGQQANGTVDVFGEMYNNTRLYILYKTVFGTE